MKALTRVFGFLVLAGLICSPVIAERNVKFTLSLAGSISSLNSDIFYSYEGITEDRWGEQITMNSQAESGTLLGGNIGAGLIFGGLEIYVGYNFSTGQQTGEVFFEIPSSIKWDDFASAQTETDLKMSQNNIEFGVAYHMNGSSVEPYLGAGISIISAQVEVPENIFFQDEYHGHMEWVYYHGYWWEEFTIDTHKVSIKEIEIQTENLNTIGFHVKGGVDIWVAQGVALFLEGKYTHANSELPIRIMATGTEVAGIQDQEVVIEYEDTREFIGQKEEPNISLGGMTALAGIKISF